MMPSDHERAAIDALALELAALAGSEIQNAFSRPLTVDYKGAAGTFRSPVSEVDHQVEAAIRQRVSARFPGHEVLGEETQAGVRADTVWVVDPVDGTTNFINGFPLFSASIGVLHEGRPIAGALWVSTSHLLRPGVYHTGAQGTLCFDGEPVRRAVNPQVRRRLAGDPHGSGPKAPWDRRKTGSAAIECAFAAAGLLQVVRFEQPHVWDVAGGIALAQAAGRAVRIRHQGQWAHFENFGPPASLRDWREPILIGEPAAVEQAIALHR